MKLNLFTVGDFYDKEDKEKLEKLGFVFTKTPSHVISYFANGTDIEFTINKSMHPTIEINSIEELMELINNYGSVIISTDTITIFDEQLD